MGNSLWSYKLFPFLWTGLFVTYRSYLNYSTFGSIFLSLGLSYLPTYIESLRWGRKGGMPLIYFQKRWYWKWIKEYFYASVEVETPLNHSQLYIFCCHPHGPTSFNHMLTMTDCCGMLSQHYKGQRRDLGASVLFYIPFFKDFLLFLGCVDAGHSTANYNLSKGNSLFIYIGGEKEQLMSETGKHKIFVKNRKGFIKLALKYGAHVVPMYAFGENDVYTTSNILLGFRMWLQKNFSIGIPICFGRYGSIFPHRKRMAVVTI